MAEDPDEVTNRVLTLPNVLSVARLFGVPLFLWLVLVPEADGWALVVLMVSGITDWLDGKLARTLHQTSKLGQILDPVADRCYILAVVIGLALRDIIPWWLAVCLAVARRLLVRARPVPAHPWLQRLAGALPRQGRDRQPALRVSAAASRRRRRHLGRRWPTSSAGPSPSGERAFTGGQVSSTPTRSLS